MLDLLTRKDASKFTSSCRSPVPASDDGSGVEASFGFSIMYEPSLSIERVDEADWKELDLSPSPDLEPRHA